MPIKTVLIVVAMEAEAAPMIEKFGLSKENPSLIPGPAPSLVYAGMHNGCRVVIACNGKDLKTEVDNVGTVAAALTTYLAILAYKPDLVISAGTAGGFRKRGGCIGDVYLGTAVVNHDRRIPIPGFDKYGIGHHDCISTSALATVLELKHGVVSSGNSLDFTTQDMSVMDELQVHVKEMEAAAIGWVCHLFHNTPFFCVKAITDIVDGEKPTADEFLENLGAAARALQGALPRIVDFVLDKEVADL